MSGRAVGSSSVILAQKAVPIGACVVRTFVLFHSIHNINNHVLMFSQIAIGLGMYTAIKSSRDDRDEVDSAPKCYDNPHLYTHAFDSIVPNTADEV